MLAPRGRESGVSPGSVSPGSVCCRAVGLCGLFDSREVAKSRRETQGAFECLLCAVDQVLFFCNADERECSPAGIPVKAVQ
ncbi:MAG: hypothetical protein ACKPJD_02140, partial [Planctomycetaceae bacterium]